MAQRIQFNLLQGLMFTLLATGSSLAQDQGIQPPSLGQQASYSEYWEQQFLFDDGTFATSQFLITNLPISKHHGIQIGTLVGNSTQAYGGRVIIKNGRPRDGWGFEPTKQSLSIFSHVLAGQHPGYLMRLANTAAELDVLFSAGEDAIELVAPNGPFGLPQITLYAPLSQAFARWRPGPEIGGDAEAIDWIKIGHGHGIGVHVRQTHELHKSIRRWTRMTGTKSSAGVPVPVLHQFVTPRGEASTVLLLLSLSSPPQRFDNVTLIEKKTGTTWNLQASMEGQRIIGTVVIDKPLDHFILKDHLSGIEKLVAGASADIDRTQTIARYTLSLETATGTKQLTGDAIFEDVIVGEGRRKRNRRLR